MDLPPLLGQWFAQRGWVLHPHQQTMLALGAAGRSALLVAPTGAGKTMAGFLPSLVELTQAPQAGVHTLYLSPLKALAQDIRRNLLVPVEEMGLPITVESRTGDTTAAARARQRKHPPNIWLTTPESLALMLTYADSKPLFSTLKTIIIDEIHAFAATKRGDHTALLLERLREIAPQARRVGLSATVAETAGMRRWLGGMDSPLPELVLAADKAPPEVEILDAGVPLPMAGHFPRHAVPAMYEEVKKAKASILFINTRAQAELLFQALWEINSEGLPIALHHGSLTKEQRLKVEAAMASGAARCVVATGSLDLGIDWGDVALVVQVGAPKGIGRLLQRIGRSNHQYDKASRALLVPTNRLELLECEAALMALKEGALEPVEALRAGSLDVLVQFILTAACAEPAEKEALYRSVTRAVPYAALDRASFEQAFACVVDGGYVLRRYAQHHRLSERPDGWVPTTKKVVQRHRMNIGTIVEAEKLKVMRVTGRPGGKRRKVNGYILGEVEERFVLDLAPGDSFLFAGQLLRFERIRDMAVEVTPAVGQFPKVPTYLGGKMPMSTYLGERVRALLNDGARQAYFP